MIPQRPGGSGWRSLSPAARVLVANGLAFNLGFYMLMPYLAQHLGDGLELAGWVTGLVMGLVMGLRVFSQQGLFLLGGWLGDPVCCASLASPPPTK